MSTQDKQSSWIAISIVASVLLAALVFGDRFWGDKSVTSYQVTKLIESVDKLGNKLEGLAKQSSVDALAGKVDGIGTDMIEAKRDIKDLQGGTKDLRADVNGLMRPTPFRNPKN